MLKELLQKAFAEAPAPSWPTYDGKTLDRNDFLTSSQAAGCLRRTWFDKNTHTIRVGQNTNGYAERGHAIEAWLVNRLRPLEAHGWKFEYVGEDQRSFYDPDAGVSGTPDGLVTAPSGLKYLLEIKSIDPRYNKNNLPKRQHIMQCHQNTFLVQKCLNIEIAGILLVYVDASNVFDIIEFPFPYDKVQAGHAILRAKELFEAKEADDLKPEGLFNGDCDTCPFTSQCSATKDFNKALAEAGAVAAPFFDGDVPTGGDLLDTPALTSAEEQECRDFLAAHKEAKKWVKAKELLSIVLKEFIMTKHNGLVIIDDTVLTTTNMAGRETVDKDALRDAGIDISSFMKTGAPFVQINVKEVKGK